MVPRVPTRMTLIIMAGIVARLPSALGTTVQFVREGEMSIFVVRAFVRMREALASNQQILSKLTELERQVEGHDASIQDLVEAIRELMEPPPSTGRRIGFALAAASDDPSGRSH